MTVPLTPAGQKGIQDGTLVAVEAQAISGNGWNMPAAGYREFMRASP